MPAPELVALQRVASVATLCGFRPPDDPLSSWIGAVLLGAPGEVWPEGLGPVCQIVIAELPAPPPRALADVALLTCFLDLDALPYETPHGDGWLVRTYESADGLVPLAAPEGGDIKPFPLRWAERAEFPSRDEVPAELDDAHDELDDDQLGLDGLKVGGWPQTIQSEIVWPPDTEFVFQVDSDEKAQLYIGDAGTAYFGRSPTQGWQMRWQCF